MAINASKLDPNQTGILVNKYDATANDSDKDWTVPAGKTWELRWAHAILVSTATVGNRHMVLEVQDDDGVVRIDIEAGAVQAESNTYHYGYLKGIYRETSFTNGEIQVPIPEELVLHPGWKIRFYDNAAVDAAADDLTVSFQVFERDC